MKPPIQTSRGSVSVSAPAGIAPAALAGKRSLHTGRADAGEYAGVRLAPALLAVPPAFAAAQAAAGKIAIIVGGMVGKQLAKAAAKKALKKLAKEQKILKKAAKKLESKKAKEAAKALAKSSSDVGFMNLLGGILSVPIYTDVVDIANMFGYDIEAAGAEGSKNVEKAMTKFAQESGLIDLARSLESETGRKIREMGEEKQKLMRMDKAEAEREIQRRLKGR